MNRAELIELVANGESAGLEFKRDDVRPERLAWEVAALLNLEGATFFSASRTTGR